MRTMTMKRRKPRWRIFGYVFCSSFMSSRLTKQFLKRILNFGNSLDWFLMGLSILTAIGAGTVRSNSILSLSTFTQLTSFGDRLCHSCSSSSEGSSIASQVTLCKVQPSHSINFNKQSTKVCSIWFTFSSENGYWDTSACCVSVSAAFESRPLYV